MAVEELKKPDGVSCKHIRKHIGGCKIYANRPESCKSYVCCYHTWVQNGDKVPISLRPNHSHVIIDYMPDMDAHFVRTLSPYQNAWAKAPVAGVIAGMVLQGLKIILMVDGSPVGKFREDTTRQLTIVSDSELGKTIGRPSF